jgi:uncharacterized membrane protein
LKLNLLFLGLNALGTFMSIQAGWKYHGTGLMMTAIITGFVSFIMVNHLAGGLEYEVFRKAAEQERQQRKS